MLTVCKIIIDWYAFSFTNYIGTVKKFLGPMILCVSPSNETNAIIYILTPISCFEFMASL